MNELATNASAGLQQAWANIILFVPKVFMFAAILVIGYVLARFLCKLFNKLLERVGFDRLVERGGIKSALARTNWDASHILSKVLYYFVMLFTLQLAFGVFGPNPISTLLTGIITYLPNVFVAAIIIVVVAAIAAGVKRIIQAALGGLSYGRTLGLAASVAIWTVGVFAALNQLAIAPAIVNGLFYALLAVFVGSAIVGIGGAAIVPLRDPIERLLTRMQQEAPKMKTEAKGAEVRIQGQAETWKHEVEHAHEESPELPEQPRFRVQP